MEMPDKCCHGRCEDDHPENFSEEKPYLEVTGTLEVPGYKMPSWSAGLLADIESGHPAAIVSRFLNICRPPSTVMTM
jgi:hypothetical protein